MEEGATREKVRAFGRLAPVATQEAAGLLGLGRTLSKQLPSSRSPTSMATRLELTPIANVLTMEEARRIASNIAKLRLF